MRLFGPLGEYAVLSLPAQKPELRKATPAEQSVFFFRIEWVAFFSSPQPGGRPTHLDLTSLPRKPSWRSMKYALGLGL